MMYVMESYEGLFGPCLFCLINEYYRKSVEKFSVQALRALNSSCKLQKINALRKFYKYAKKCKKRDLLLRTYIYQIIGIESYTYRCCWENYLHINEVWKTRFININFCYKGS